MGRGARDKPVALPSTVVPTESFDVARALAGPLETFVSGRLLPSLSPARASAEMTVLDQGGRGGEVTYVAEYAILPDGTRWVTRARSSMYLGSPAWMQLSQLAPDEHGLPSFESAAPRACPHRKTDPRACEHALAVRVLDHLGASALYHRPVFRWTQLGGAFRWSADELSAYIAAPIDAETWVVVGLGPSVVVKDSVQRKMCPTCGLESGTGECAHLALARAVRPPFAPASDLTLESLLLCGQSTPGARHGPAGNALVHVVHPDLPEVCAQIEGYPDRAEGLVYSATLYCHLSDQALSDNRLPFRLALPAQFGRQLWLQAGGPQRWVFDPA